MATGARGRPLSPRSCWRGNSEDFRPFFGPLTRAHDEGMTTQRGTPSVHAIRPTTRPGRLSLILLGVALAALVAMMAAAASGQTGGETFSDNWLLATLGLVMAAGAVGAGSAAWYAIFRRRECSVLIGIPALVGLLATFFIVGEFFGPSH